MSRLEFEVPGFEFANFDSDDAENDFEDEEDEVFFGAISEKEQRKRTEIQQVLKQYRRQTLAFTPRKAPGALDFGVHTDCSTPKSRLVSRDSRSSPGKLLNASPLKTPLAERTISSLNECSSPQASSPRTKVSTTEGVFVECQRALPSPVRFELVQAAEARSQQHYDMQSHPKLDHVLSADVSRAATELSKTACALATSPIRRKNAMLHQAIYTNSRRVHFDDAGSQVVIRLATPTKDEIQQLAEKHRLNRASEVAASVRLPESPQRYADDWASAVPTTPQQPSATTEDRLIYTIAATDANTPVVKDTRQVYVSKYDSLEPVAEEPERFAYLATPDRAANIELPQEKEYERVELLATPERAAFVELPWASETEHASLLSTPDRAAFVRLPEASENEGIALLATPDRAVHIVLPESNALETIALFATPERAASSVLPRETEDESLSLLQTPERACRTMLPEISELEVQALLATPERAARTMLPEMYEAEARALLATPERAAMTLLPSESDELHLFATPERAAYVPLPIQENERVELLSTPERAPCMPLPDSSENERVELMETPERAVHTALPLAQRIEITQLLATPDRAARVALPSPHPQETFELMATPEHAACTQFLKNSEVAELSNIEQTVNRTQEQSASTDSEQATVSSIQGEKSFPEHSSHVLKMAADKSEQQHTSAKSSDVNDNLSACRAGGVVATISGVESAQASNYPLEEVDDESSCKIEQASTIVHLHPETKHNEKVFEDSVETQPIEHDARPTMAETPKGSEMKLRRTGEVGQVSLASNISHAVPLQRATTVPSTSFEPTPNESPTTLSTTGQNFGGIDHVAFKPDTAESPVELPRQSDVMEATISRVRTDLTARLQQLCADAERIDLGVQLPPRSRSRKGNLQALRGRRTVLARSHTTGSEVQ